MKERIQKVLSNAGVASRRSVEEMVLQGRIAVNGKTVRALPVLVNPEADRIDVDGERIRLGGGQSEKRYYFLLNKPRGVYSTNVAQGAQVRAVDLLPKELKVRLYPVGRLDSEAKGLLLLTNDGELTNRLTHPRYGVPKTYRATVDGYLRDEVIGQMKKGVWLADRAGKGFKAEAGNITIVKRMRDKTVLDIVLREGPNRQIRRMLAKLGHKVKDLVRVRMGPLTIEGLKPGQFRVLTPRELRQLKQSGKEGSQRERRRVVREEEDE